MGLLCFLFGNYPFGPYIFIYILFYLFGTFSFFLILQYLVIKDNFNQLTILRSIKYFTDLAIIKYQSSYKILLVLLMFTLFNFMGIPPLLGF
jgi:NADH:ubiquinone oxidoreductase subunit 2 (subunit N)